MSENLLFNYAVKSILHFNDIFIKAIKLDGKLAVNIIHKQAEDVSKAIFLRNDVLS